MERDFRYLRDKYGDAGARDVFEKICTSLFQSIYGAETHSIKVNQGDGGIDVLVGDFSYPIEVFQCKYFIDGIGEAQKGQIRKSFKTAINSKDYKMLKWVLCIPCVMNKDEFSWWSDWKTKKENEYEIKINLYDGDFLIKKLKECDLYNQIFDEDIRNSLNEIISVLQDQKVKLLSEIIVEAPENVEELYNDLIFVKKLEMAKIDDVEQCKTEYYNAEYAEYVVKSKGITEQSNSYDKVKSKVQSLWSTQYRLHKDDVDGNLLLAKTYERIENEDGNILDCSSVLPEIGLIAKKGMLHQLAEECSVGWVSDYKSKLKKALEQEDN